MKKKHLPLGRINEFEKFIRQLGGGKNENSKNAQGRQYSKNCRKNVRKT